MVKPISDTLLKNLRSCFKNSNLIKEEIYAYIIPHNDSHQNEYIANCDNRLEYVTGFSGSYGTAVVTENKAALWTDGRYHIQAEKQIDLKNWNLMREGLDDVPNKEEWLFSVCPPKARIGVDPTLISNGGWKGLETALKKKHLSLVPVLTNLIDTIWLNRPPKPTNPVFPLDLSYSGVDWRSKVSQVLEIMSGSMAVDGTPNNGGDHSIKADHILFSALDEIAWLLNLRGSDIEFNPVFFAYALLSTKTNDRTNGPTSVEQSEKNSELTLFFREGMRSIETFPEVMVHLGMGTEVFKNGETIGDANPALEISKDDSMSITSLGDKSCKIRVLPYDSVWPTLSSIKFATPDSKIWLSSDSSHAIFNSVPDDNIYSTISPILNLKAIKNGVELEGAKQAHVLDAISLCETFSWLQHHMTAKHSKTILTEMSVAAKLLQLKEDLGPEFRGLSFDTISSTGPNSAIIHYKPTTETDRALSQDEIFLCDSGGQYFEVCGLFRSGTTDVTRTFYFGEQPDPHIKDCYTRVLKGHLALSRATFPQNVKGCRLDTLSRIPLWEVGLDYLHGTGHGVGSFLNVHEGPVWISTRPRSLSNTDEMGMKENMLVTVEPGYYESGKFGIRIENTCYCTKIKTKFNFNDTPYLTLQPLTLVPYQLKLIDQNLLTQQEIDQINSYHNQCREVVGNVLKSMGKSEALNWLLNESLPLPNKYEVIKKEYRS